MLRHSLYTALRHLKKNRLYAGIQLLGLALCMTTSLLLLRYATDEWAFDCYHEKADRLFRLTTRVTTGDSDDHVAFSLFVVGPRVQALYPEVEGYARVLPSYHKKAVQYGEKRFNEAHVYAADAAVLSLFTYPLLEGNPRAALAGPGSVVVSQTFARKYFDGQSPLGQTLAVNGAPYRVTGLMRDVPPQSDLYVDALLSLDDPEAELDEWAYTFLLLKPGATAAVLEKKLADFAREPLFDSYDEDASNLKATYYLEPLPVVHFLPGRLYDGPKGNKAYLLLFTTVAVLLLAVAGINSVNLSLAQSLGRSREMGVRRALGATRGQIGGLAAAETGLLLGGATLATGLLTAALLPAFNHVTGKAFTFGATLVSPAAGLLLGLAAVTGLLVGGYQGIVLSRLDPARVLKGGVPGWGRRPGAGWVAAQFAAAVTLTGGALLVHGQLTFLRERPLGFEPAGVLVVAVPKDEAYADGVRAFTTRLRGSAPVLGASLCDTGGEPGSFMNKDLFLVEKDGEMQEKVVTNLDCDAGYLPLLGIGLRSGRNFSADRPADRQEAFLVNEAFVGWMGWKEPLGKRMAYFDRRGRVIGVVRDYHYASFHQQVLPLVITYGGRPPEKVLLKARAGRVGSTLAQARQAWRDLLPDLPFEYAFLPQRIAHQYRDERRVGQLSGWGAGVAVGVASLGLFGMASLSSRRRLREIGIRKVLGAGTGSLVFLLLREFLALVLLGILPALPLAGYLGNRWLETFPYRVGAGWTYPALAGGLALGLAVLTTLYHTLAAIRTNPARTLRTE
jgi:putative ABC transport system permease protein